ncbi:hypothetical protein BpHYR1_051813 [Brachionus plicatilis]|uniref:RNA-directed DNA polymerase from mobile element jockey-like n=1 Tax=Brachionus plicatilis TaxID=10195 RepID=A0A3M7QEB3_BRAPC|nr:hypothetical protein BpHYR1_051813 [Brachionus plicatilis]
METSLNFCFYLKNIKINVQRSYLFNISIQYSILNINKYISELQKWLCKWKMKVAVENSCYIIFSKKRKICKDRTESFCFTMNTDEYREGFKSLFINYLVKYVNQQTSAPVNKRPINTSFIQKIKFKSLHNKLLNVPLNAYSVTAN